MTPRVHPSSVVEPGARIGDNVTIGPFCHIGAKVGLGRDVEIVSHVAISGDVHIGAGTKIYPFAAIGAPAQDLKSVGEEGRVVIGVGCVIREGVTINAGTKAGGAVTTVGDRCALLAYSHIAHDCRLGDRVILANNVALGGHVQLGDQVVIGGGSALHQHVRIGAHSFVAGLSGVEADAPPFMLIGGNRAHLFGLNIVGLGRCGFSPERIARLKRAYRALYSRHVPTPLDERLELARQLPDDDGDIARLIVFLREPSDRPAMAPRASRRP
ncbi:MAG TPA: acyl-ACP--UDP-N-acetylglucosamine O-acyltransferase [Methylocystis sp.]|nr:acyl-ACP--UDP-N-acetylglucosamine O-acyltransferase [Methylocystis sp.]